MEQPQFETHDVTGDRSKARLLWSLIRRDTGDPRLRAWVAEVCRDEGVSWRDRPAFLAAVQRWCQREIRYVREATETFVAPWRTLEWRIADCDDFARLVCSALRSVAVPARLVCCGWLDAGTTERVPLRHVYPEAWDGSRWVALECVRRVPYGWSCVDWRRGRGDRVRVLTKGDRPDTFGGG